MVERVAQALVQMTPAPCREQRAAVGAPVQRAVQDQRPALEPPVVEAAPPRVAAEPEAAVLAVVSSILRF